MLLGIPMPMRTEYRPVIMDDREGLIQGCQDSTQARLAPADMEGAVPVWRSREQKRWRPHLPVGEEHTFIS